MEARIERLLEAYRGDQPAACVLARHRGQIIYRRCFGQADLETGTAATPATDFRLASLTKQLTAQAVMTLVAEGRTSYDTSLAEVFPDFPEYARGITIRHLLTHTSGLFDYEDLMAPDVTEQVRDDDVLAMMRAQSTTYFPPGTQFRYSNSGYAVLARIVEQLGGERFAGFLQRTVFGPLGMDGTVAHEEGVSVVPHRAYGYSPDGHGGWERTDQSPTSAVLGDGGVYSSVDDLDRWLEVVEGRRRLLPAETAAEATTASTLADGSSAGYGFGWFVGGQDGHSRLHHTGSTIGFRNAVERLPDADLTVLLLTNRNDIDEHLMAELVRVFLDQVGEPG